MANRIDSITIKAADVSGLGNSATRDVGTTSGKVAAGDDSRLNTIDGKTGGKVKGDYIVLDNTYGHTTQLMTYNPGSAGTHFGGMVMKRPNSQGYVLSQYSTSDYEVASVTIGIDGPGGSVSWAFNRNGQAVGNWQPASDVRIKHNIKRIVDPLAAMRSISGCEWDRLDNGLHGYGFIAQEVEVLFPQAVTVAGDIKLNDDSVVEDAKTVDTFGLSAALHHEAILALMETVDNLTAQVAQLQAEVQALKS
ncbi:MAG: tail fiber domain-containing protein [Leclercia adecarboxylata]|nr:tail fiber domain-containing protein [uncultured Leclercia sp.]MDU4843250.1 tail fiber domain-containing protein [Leclercia adecarboxylata]